VSRTRQAMNLSTTFSQFISDMMDRHFSIASPSSLQTYLGALVLLALLFVVRRRALGVSFRGFWRAVFPAKILNHRSTKVDMLHYAFNAVLLSAAYGSVIFTGEYWYRVTSAMFHALGLPDGLVHAPAGVVLIVTALVELAMLELGYWLGHYLMHRTPALWEFHKVHHSAEVLTPLTEWRQHPVEMVLIPNIISMTVGAGYAVLWIVFGAAQPATLFGVNIFLLMFTMTTLHLRHSHVWLPFTGILGCLLQSPAHHQIHHSTNPKHFDKNLGFGLSIWDWAFGTLWIPAKREHLEFGIGDENAVFETMHGTVVRPFVKAGEHIAGALRPSGGGPAVQAGGDPA
jgi:sterol desaturase/sphingolipid hydroxylase (fatty acid hydroxylase superfamily)